MKNPKVSIIIPVYNGSDYVAEAIDSALAQTYFNYEVIVVNDGSKDNNATDKICRSFGKKIRYYQKPNGGVASALNFGIKKMTGEYFSWLSHDDLYYPEKLAKQIKFLKKQTKNTICYTDYDLVDSYNNLIRNVKITPPKEYLISNLLLKSFLHGCSLLIPKNAFNKLPTVES